MFRPKSSGLNTIEPLRGQIDSSSAFHCLPYSTVRGQKDATRKMGQGFALLMKGYRSLLETVATSDSVRQDSKLSRTRIP